MSFATRSEHRRGGHPFPSPRPHYSVPDTEENRDHAAEAEEIEQELLAYGIEVDKVAPTRDRAGHVRLNFDAAAWILDMLDNAYQGVPPQLG